ncbi:hypothetical protein [Ornithinimicrobium murale]|uniref:hypothetical protein n=1 Tax=Ornithinimicrobium murale TaxID=1050153 RepID=UPI000E0D8CE0|nr:hypothetical protein [Ornithinimicrobium murale]
MGKDELRQALNQASEGPERDFTNTWMQGRRVRRRRQTAQGLGGVALAAAAVGVFALGGGNLLGEDATIDPLPPATQSPTEQTTEATEPVPDPTGEAATEEPTGGTVLPGPDDPLPTTVEEYAAVYLAAGLAGDEALLERMGTDGAVEASVTWTGLSWLPEPQVSEAESGEALVRYLAEGPYGLTLRIDRAAAESGAEDAVLHGETGDATEAMTSEEYADLVVELFRSWPEDYSMGVYATERVQDELTQVPSQVTWERTGSVEDGDHVLVTYLDAESGNELVLTVDRALVEARDYYAVVAVEFTGEPIAPSGPPEGSVGHPCDEPWSQVSPAGAGGASEEVALTALDLIDLAASCDIDGLVGIAEQDGTAFSPGGLSPKDAFAGEDGRDRVAALAILLSAYEPVLEANDGVTVAQWPELPVDELDGLAELGLYTAEEIDAMRADGGYTGWRITIAEDGTWLGLTSGT